MLRDSLLINKGSNRAEQKPAGYIVFLL